MVVPLSLILISSAYYFFVKADVSKLDESNLPKFVSANFIDLNDVGMISKFRSGAGHDYSSAGEWCRSMKHYFSPVFTEQTKQLLNSKSVAPPGAGNSAKIFSPVNGKVVAATKEKNGVGQQISIKPDGYAKYTVRLFHIYLLPAVAKGSAVQAGQQIGVVNRDLGTDVAVQYGPPFVAKDVSYFQVMQDSVFQSYQKYGITDKSQLIITKAERDKNPLTCTKDGQFVQNSGTQDITSRDYVTLVK